MEKPSPSPSASPFGQQDARQRARRVQWLADMTTDWEIRSGLTRYARELEAEADRNPSPHVPPSSPPRRMTQAG